MADELGAEHVELEELFERAHYVTIHTPRLKTASLVGRRELAHASGIVLVNTAAPEIVDPGALLEALAEGRVARAGVDGEYDPPHRDAFRALPDERFVVVPRYLSWNTALATERGWEAFLESVAAFVEGRRVPHRVL